MKRTQSNLRGGWKLVLHPNPSDRALARSDIPPGGFARTVRRFRHDPGRLDGPAVLRLNDLSNVGE